MAAADLVPDGIVAWGELVPELRSGVYVVSLTEEPDAATNAITVPPFSDAALRRWLEVRPELRLDRRQPTLAELATRLRTRIRMSSAAS
jgi:hypothetical protein